MIRRYWLSASVLLCVMVLVFWLAYGFAARWGADQWGPYAEWFAGVATVAAVVVALRESARGRRAREIDYEVARRRECLKALGELWAALMQVSMDFVAFREFLNDLPESFDAGENRWQGRGIVMGGPSLGEEINEQIQMFYSRWMQVVEPSLFVARSLLNGTPMQADIEAISADIYEINNAVLPQIRDVAVQLHGRRPDTTVLTMTWTRLYERRNKQLKMANEHFSLESSHVEKAILRGR